MEEIAAYTHASRIGSFAIVRQPDGRWRCKHDDEWLSKPWPLAWQALEELVGGHTDWPGGVDPSTLGLPDELADWMALRPKRA